LGFFVIFLSLSLRRGVNATTTNKEKKNNEKNKKKKKRQFPFLLLFSFV